MSWSVGGTCASSSLLKRWVTILNYVQTESQAAFIPACGEARAPVWQVHSAAGSPRLRRSAEASRHCAVTPAESVVHWWDAAERCLMGRQGGSAELDSVLRAAGRDQHPGEIEAHAIGVGVVGAERTFVTASARS